MKITAHFAPRVRDLAGPASVALWAVAVLMLATAAWFARSAWVMREETLGLRERLAAIEARLQELNAREPLPPAGGLADIKQRVAAVNALTGIRGWPVPVMLSRLEQLLPETVRLVSLHHKLREGEVQILAEGGNAEALTAFMGRLEKEPHFAEVMLVKQMQPGNRADGGVQFDLRLREKP